MQLPTLILRVRVYKRHNRGRLQRTSREQALRVSSNTPDDDALVAADCQFNSSSKSLIHFSALGDVSSQSGFSFEVTGEIRSLYVCVLKNSVCDWHGLASAIGKRRGLSLESTETRSFHQML